MIKKTTILITAFFLIFLSPHLLANSAHSLPLISQSSTTIPDFITDYSNISQANRLVDIGSVNPNIRLDIRYATPNNFLKRTLYPVPRCLLRLPFAQRLSKVQEDLEQMGLGLMVYDCYRPWSVTRDMWEILPDSRYVGNPARGSRHNRGAAVDLTLVDFRTSQPLEMPTDFDDFTEKAARDYQGNPPQVRRNSDLLEFKMKKHGFEPLITEWWHFDAKGWENYALLNIGVDQVP